MLPTSMVVDLLDLVTAASGTEAEQRVFGWSVEDRVRVAFLGRFDFLFGLFGLLWTSAFAVACALGSRVFRSGLLVELGSLLVWLALFAYLLDFTENLASRQSTRRGSARIEPITIHFRPPRPWPTTGSKFSSSRTHSKT